MRQPHEYESPGCREVGGDWWFPEKDGTANSAEYKIAKSICFSCVHRVECAEWGIANERYGIWGGIPEKERAKIRAKRGIRIREAGIA